ncbi:Fc.00g070660.m01.CDS01 [Cosmosporella sp. VM-42]
MPSEKQPFYDPIPPTYDEALASGSHYDPADWEPRARSPTDERDAPETEQQSLLQHSNAAPSSSRRPDGYRPPTVETDDEDSLWDSDSDAEEAAQVRREMQEMEIEEPNRPQGSSWGKRIGFTLPKWKWSWRPRLPRLRIQLPSRAPAPAANSAEAENDTTDNETESWTQRWLKWPKVNSTFFIILFARSLAIFIVLGFLYLLFASDFFSGLSRRLGGGFRFNPEDLKVHVQNSVDPRRMRASVQHFSSYAHIAGTEGDYATAMDVESMFSRAGLDEVVLDDYHVYINYPRKDGRSVQIMDGNDHTKAIWTAYLEEKEVGGETAGRQTYAFHGHSKSGDVKGPLIYANYGSRWDFQHIQARGINTTGAIALVRYYGSQGDRALKVKAAELAGFAGCLIYSDPADDGFLKGEVAPNGPYMPEDGVQRGAVSLMSWVVGDVLTPGWESKKGQPRMKPADSPGLVQIPSLPLAWRDAQVLLQHIKGHGEKVPGDWEGGVPNVDEWWTGDSSSPIVRLQNEQDEEEQQPIWNVYGKIIGMEQTAKSILIGNHRDAWSFGATDPHSGTAVMIEMARIFGDLLARGWRPLRTIEFMSWDAEEYNLIGSTEFVEKNLDSLRDNAYAYINLDTAVFGGELHASGSPVFKKTLDYALGRIMDPYQNATLKQLWDRRQAELEGLGAGSDYVAFQDIAGTSSLDLSFEGASYPYHSSYDNFKLMEEVIDPGFVYHSLLGQLVGLLILDLADRPILPFDMSEYGRRLEGWVKDLEKWATDKIGKRGGKSSISFRELMDAVKQVQRNADQFEKWEMDWNAVISSSGGWEANDVGELRLDYNNKMANFDTRLLDLELGGGVPNRTQFKHVVFGPQLWSGYDEAFFPAIRDIIEAEDWDEAKRYIAKTSAILRQAATELEM